MGVCNWLFLYFSDAQRAIEQINRMCKPMRAEFTKPRENYKFENASYGDEPHNAPLKIRLENRKFRGPFTEKYGIEFPQRRSGITLENYNGSNLAKVDPTKNFFNETALCDVLKIDEDIQELESATESHKLENFIWSYK